MSSNRLRHHTDGPGNTHQHLSGSQLPRGHYQQSTRHLQRHASDVSSDRLRFYESNYRPPKDVQRTDYPARKRDNRTDLGSIHAASIPEHRADQLNRDAGGSQSSQGSQGSGQVVFRQKPSSTSSLDRSSYSGQDSHTSSIRESGSRFKMMEPGYGIPNVLVGSLKSSGTPNSSQSDELHMERTSSLGHPSSSHYHRMMPRSQSTQATPLSSYSQGGKGWQLNDEVDGPPRQFPLSHRYSGGQFHEREEYISPRPQPSPHYYPQSPVSPISSSYSSESDRFSPAPAKNVGKAWYEEEDPDIHSGLYFPTANNRQTHHLYERIPHNGYDQYYDSHSPSPQLPEPTEHKQLAKQRLDYYFSKQDHSNRPNGSRHSSRRESSPAEYGRSGRYDVESPLDRKFSDSEVMLANQECLREGDHKKVKRVKSGGIGFGKLVKKIGNRRARLKEEIEPQFRGTRSHSMEHIDVKSHNSDTNLIRKTDSPAFTPKLSKHKHRQNSEPDLESALGLFRSGSRKNLFMDPVDALFEAIEGLDYEQCLTLLQEHQIDLTRVNDDDWNPLDLAVMLNDQIANLLLQYGAKDSNKYFKDPKTRYHHVMDLMNNADEEKRAIGEMMTVNSKELQKQLNKWRNKSQLLDRMLDNIRRTAPPSPPRDVTLFVTSDRTLSVKFSEPESTNGSPVTRYKVQWSRNERFVPESGEFVLCDGRKEITIPGLDKGERYYVRVFAFNMKGFSPPKSANPSYAIPSSWHDYSNSKPRFEGCTDRMSNVFMRLNQYLIEQQHLETGGTPGTPNSNSKRSLRKGLTRLFSQGAKFCKTQKSGVYFACLMHSEEGRILVTVDDYLPIIEISDSHPSSIGTDFSWLTKLSCTWENIREMCESTEGHTTSPSIQFRFRLLQAVAAMQIGTGQTNLGLVHHRTFQDSQGATVFLAVQYIEDYKSLTGNNKWSNFVKIMKKYPVMEEVFGHGLTDSQKTDKLSAVEQLVMDIPNIIHHHSNCYNTLSKGLYLGYLKARLSLASMTLVTSSTLPNVFPHYQIRPNPNISREEWAWIHSLGSPDYEVTMSRVSSGNQVLQKTLLPSIEHFLEILGIAAEEVENHQLYIDEVIELNENVTFLLLMPPPDQVCTPPGSKDEFDGQHFSHLPISAFELLQLHTYQRAFVSSFSMVSCRLDVEMPICQKKMRESLSKSETTALKKVKENFDKYQEETESVWKHMRWIEAAVQSARSTSLNSRLTIKQFREKMKIVKRMSTSTSASSLSSSTSGNTLSPTRKSLPSVSSVLPSRQLIVYPGYETGLAKGTTVKVQVNTATTAFEVIKFVVNEFSKAGNRQRFSDREMHLEFHLASVWGRHEDILPMEYTPLQMLNYSNKYKFIVRQRPVNQCTTEV